MDISTKRELYQSCLAQLTIKIEDLQGIIRSINDSKNNETKSSAGDKYETGRAMMQMEEDKITAQLELAQQQQSQLKQLSTEAATSVVRLGSLVKTDQRIYFLAVSLGKVRMEGQTYFCISPAAPVGRLLLGKEVGEVITFGTKQERIIAVC